MLHEKLYAQLSRELLDASVCGMEIDMKQNMDKPLEEQTLEELQVSIHESKRKLRRGIILAVTTLVTLIFVCVAWFQNNAQVSGTGIGIANAEAGFELAAEGEDGGYYSSMLEALGENTGSATSNLFKTTLKEIKGFMTASTNQSIVWTMTADSNLQNRNSDTVTTTAIGSGLAGDDMRPGISPGTSGTLTFYVVPKTSGTLTVNFQLSMDLYKEVAQYSASADDITEVELNHIEDDGTVSDDKEKVYITKVEDETAQDIISGHILFFETKDSDGYYSDQIVDGAFQKTFENAVAGKAYAVTIYWVWPYVLGQTLLPSQAYLGSDIQIFASEDSESRQKMFNDMWNNVTKYFQNTDTFIVDMIKHVYENDYTSTEYALLNSAYNSADQYIGNNVRYFVLHLNASS
jgi:hypothetical protein